MDKDKDIQVANKKRSSFKSFLSRKGRGFHDYVRDADYYG